MTSLHSICFCFFYSFFCDFVKVVLGVLFVSFAHSLLGSLYLVSFSAVSIRCGIYLSFIFLNSLSYKHFFVIFCSN